MTLGTTLMIGLLRFVIAALLHCAVGRLWTSSEPADRVPMDLDEE